MLVAVLSVKGSPGVTTVAVAVAARWPQPARTVVVEADPSGGDLAVRFSLASTPGLLSLAAAARRSTDPATVWQHTQALPGGLPVVTAPPDADRARAALAELDPGPDAVGVLRRAADTPGAVVIADCGRIDAGSPAMPIVRAADVMVLLTGSHADDLAHLARRLPAMGGWTPRPVLLLVGDGYSTTEVARELGVPPLGRIPHDPAGAAVLCGRPSRVRWNRGGPSQSVLGQVAHKIATVLATPPPPRTAGGPLPEAGVGVAVLRAVPGVPDGPIAPGGLRHAPLPWPPPMTPSAHESTNGESTRGGAAS